MIKRKHHYFDGGGASSSRSIVTYLSLIEARNASSASLFFNGLLTGKAQLSS